MTPTIAKPAAGTPVSQLDTPCMVVDLDALEHNMRVMAETYANSSCKLRPHVKNHRSPEIIRRQMAMGGTVEGVCSAKVSEAEVFVDAGIPQVLIANQAPTLDKVRRLAALANRADIIVAVDAPEHVGLLADGAQEADVTIGVVIEINTSMGRAGIREADTSVALARLVTDSPGLRFRGIMSHQTMDGMPDRETRYLKAREYFAIVLEVKRVLEEAGFPVEIVSAGETWTYDVAAETPGITEVQGGTYIMMSVPYSYMRDFKYAARVYGTVISTPAPDTAIGDVPVEAIGAPDGELPTVEGLPGVRVRMITPEHTVLEMDSRKPLRVGDRFALITHQQDITMTRWDQYVVARDGLVVDVWDVPARGRHH
ncbi:MAG: alanine racemase [Dehalococcoidia bacterium]